jgi:SET domain-containing protein
MSHSQRFQPGPYLLRVARSRTGRGIFTESFIPKGSCIIEYLGRPVTEKEQYENRGKYLFWTSDTTMIDGNIKENTAKYINHSCIPNCEVDIYKKRIYVFAKRNIKVGEELHYDYDTEYFEQHIKPKGCLCHKCSPDILDIHERKTKPIQKSRKL